MKRILTLLVCLSVTMSLFAIPAKRHTFTVTQKDGTQLTLQLVGDENLHYFQNVATGEKMLKGQDGDYYVMSDATLTTMTTVAKARRATQETQRTTRRNAMRRVGTVGSAMTGTKKGLVILVNFSDKSMASAHTQSAFDNQFNQEGYTTGGHLGSVHDYFYDQSYGAFDLDFDVVGPVTVSNTMSYYGSNDSNGSDKYPATMVIEACKLADAAGVNFADYDWDGDGYVDQVYVVYAGYGESYGADDSTIWPHEWDLKSAKSYGDGTGALTLDGVTINTYACSCELAGTSGSTLNGIGTACHEFSHCLGFPDFYDTSYAGGFGMNSWDLMDAGSYNGPSGYGEVPAGYTSYERWVAGWVTPTELSSPATITAMKSLNDYAEAYIIYNDANSNEYILLENRQNTKWFKYVDTYTTPHGLLAIHVDYDQTAWDNDEPNNTASHQRMSIIPASGTYGTLQTSSGQSYYSCSETQLKGHPFSGSGSKTSLTGSTNTSSGGKWFTACSTGSTTLNHEVTEISNASDGTISFLFDGGAVADDGSRYTVTLNPGTGTCGTASWTQTDFQESMTLPTATAPNDDWTFLGWSTAEVEETTTYPTTLTNKAGDSYQPTSDVTLYAVYTRSEAGTGASGTFTLDYSAETSLQSTTLGYGNAVNYSATDGSSWVIKAYKNSGLQINKGKSASIKVPDCPGNISSIDITAATARVFSFSDTDYTGSNSPTVAASSASSTTATIDLSSASLATGYIYTTDGASVITKVVVNYGAGATVYYNTNPSDQGLTTPTISFASNAQSMLVGDANDTYTATVTNSTGAVTYTSSNASVATVDATTGRVSAVGVGTTTITATLAAVSGVSRSASATYTLTVSMPALQSIAVTTQPTKTSYMEDENFSKDGMVVMATYANGYTQEVTTYTCDPSTSVILETTDTQITISYTEGGVTVTTTVPITVTAYVIPTITFAQAGSKDMLVGDTFTNVATANSTGAITYASSKTSVATVDSSTGLVTAKAVGTAIITATVAAVDRVSKAASTTYTVNVTMPALTGIAIATPASTTSYNEGETLSTTGLTLTATYANGYTQTISTGFTTSPANGDVLSTTDNTVTVSYTENGVTQTTTYGITVSELPKYSVTFNVIGTPTTLTEDIANTGVTPPTVADITTTINDTTVTYTFYGWTTTDVTEETATKPTIVTLTDGKYMPSENTTLYAVYTRTKGTTVQGFTLDLTYSGTTYYAGSYNSSSTRIASDTSTGATYYFADGYLWYDNDGTATYIYSYSSSKADLKSTTSKSSVTNTWTMSEDGDTVIFLSGSGRYLALNNSTTSIIRAYNSSYPNEWRRTYTGETFAMGGVSYYTGYPVSASSKGDINRSGSVTIADMAALIAILNGDTTNSKYDYDAADVDENGTITTDDVPVLQNLLLDKSE